MDKFEICMSPSEPMMQVAGCIRTSAKQDCAVVTVLRTRGQRATVRKCPCMRQVKLIYARSAR
jgi:hypothetical protein